VDMTSPLYTKGMIRVLIIEGHEPVRLALENRLRTAAELAIVGSTSSYEEALPQAQQCQPDVILLETKLPGGRETLQALRRASPAVALIVLTSYLDSQEEDVVMQLGAARYLLKTLHVQELVQEICTVASNGTP